MEQPKTLSAKELTAVSGVLTGFYLLFAIGAITGTVDEPGHIEISGLAFVCGFFMFFTALAGALFASRGFQTLRGLYRKINFAFLVIIFVPIVGLLAQAIIVLVITRS